MAPIVREVVEKVDIRFAMVADCDSVFMVPVQALATMMCTKSLNRCRESTERVCSRGDLSKQN